MAEIERHIEERADEIDERIKAMQKRHAIARIRHLQAVAETARKGGFGDEAKRIWATETGNGTNASLKALERLADELRRGGFRRV